MRASVLTVTLDPADPVGSRLHQTVLASLPARFRVTAGTADVALISGDQPGWRERAAAGVRSGIRAIMLSGFRSLTAAAVASLNEEASAAGVVVTAATPYAANPGWSTALPLIAADLGASAVLDSVIVTPVQDAGSAAARKAALRAALTGQFAMIRPLTPGFGDLTAVHASDRSYVVAGATPDISVTLSGTLSGSGGEHLDLDLVGPVKHWHAALETDTLALPARISVSGPDGEHTLPPVHESGYRAAWAALYQAIHAQAAPGYLADRLSADLALAEAALGPAVA